MFPMDCIAKLLELKWWDMPEDKLKEHIALCQKENVRVEELARMMEINARAAVFKDVEPWTVVGVNPAKVIKKRVMKEKK